MAHQTSESASSARRILARTPFRGEYCERARTFRRFGVRRILFAEGTANGLGRSDGSAFVESFVRPEFHAIRARG
jgi:hypothetical protein